jgi:hypothetical protein
VHPVLPLFGLQQIVGVDVFEPDKNPLAAGALAVGRVVTSASSVGQRDLPGSYREQ